MSPAGQAQLMREIRHYLEFWDLARHDATLVHRIRQYTTPKESQR